MSLHHDPRTDVTTGDLADAAYWRAKFAGLKLEAAVRTGQPPAAVAALAAALSAGAAEVLKAFPNHCPTAGWVARATAVSAEVGPGACPIADRAACTCRPDFACYDDPAYEFGWRSYHMAKVAVAVGDAYLTLVHAREAASELAKAKARMAQWPVDVRQFVLLALDEMSKLAARAGSRLSA